MSNRQGMDGHRTAPRVRRRPTVIRIAPGCERGLLGMLDFFLRGLGIPPARINLRRGEALELPPGPIPRSAMMLISGIPFPCHLPKWAAGMAEWELSQRQAENSRTILLNGHPLLAILNAMLHRRDLPAEIPNLVIDGRWCLNQATALPFFLESIGGLESLGLLFFDRLRDVSALDGCASLRHLTLHAPELESLATMGRPPALRSLHLPFCSSLAGIGPLAVQQGIEEVRFRGGHRLRDLGPLADLPRLRTLMVQGCAVSDLGHLAGSEALESLVFIDLPGPRSVQPLQGLRNLRKLTIRRCPGLRNLAPLGELRGLDRLDLSGFNGRRIQPVFRLRGLSELHLTKNRLEDRDLFPILQLQGLRELVLSGNPDLQKLDHLPALRHITRLRLEACPSLTSLAFLRYMEDLTELDLACCLKIRDMEFLRRCSRLERLGLGWAGLEAQETGFLNDLTGLRELVLAGWAGLRDLDLARGLPRLQNLNIQDCPGLADLSGLEHCPGLKALACDEGHLAGNAAVRWREMAITSRHCQPTLYPFEDWNPQTGLFDRIHQSIIQETIEFVRSHGRPHLDSHPRSGT